MNGSKTLCNKKEFNNISYNVSINMREIYQRYLNFWMFEKKKSKHVHVKLDNNERQMPAKMYIHLNL